ncbi:hypothetical protein LCGC14_0603370 [marine sediment metagenome]|uniref:Uncharacterized protein n=1 Tax=marine sediment metagenome TaxID=412755 RepID=A0A0F9RU20_9ZZZZ
MIKIVAKIVRDGECPLKLKIPCSECEYYDGWGFDVKRFDKGDNLKGISVFDIWCNTSSIVDVKDIKPSLKIIKK